MKKLITLALASSMMLVSSLSFSQAGLIAATKATKAKPAPAAKVGKAKLTEIKVKKLMGG